MALSISASDNTEWNIQEGSEDLEFQFKDDGETRRFRAIARLVLTRQYKDVTDITTFGADSSPPSGSYYSNGPTTSTFSFGTAYNSQVVVSDRIMPFEAKGGGFMQRVLVVEAATDWEDYTADSS